MADCPNCGEPMQRRNANLAAACARDGRSHAEIAAASDTSATWFGGVISGRVRPSAALRRRIAAALDLPEHELFDVQVPA